MKNAQIARMVRLSQQGVKGIAPSTREMQTESKILLSIVQAHHAPVSDDPTHSKMRSSPPYKAFSPTIPPHPPIVVALKQCMLEDSKHCKNDVMTWKHSKLNVSIETAHTAPPRLPPNRGKELNSPCSTNSPPYRKVRLKGALEKLGAQVKPRGEESNDVQHCSQSLVSKPTTHHQQDARD